MINLGIEETENVTCDDNVLLIYVENIKIDIWKLVISPYLPKYNITSDHIEPLPLYSHFFQLFFFVLVV